MTEKERKVAQKIAQQLGIPPDEVKAMEVDLGQFLSMLNGKIQSPHKHGAETHPDIKSEFLAAMGDSGDEDEPAKATDPETVRRLKQLSDAVNDPHNGELWARKKDNVRQQILGWSDEQLVNTFHAMLKAANCNCGDPSHWLANLAVVLVTPFVKERLNKGQQIPEEE